MWKKSTHCGQCCPGRLVLGSEQSHEEKVNRQHSCVVSASVPASRLPACVRALTSPEGGNEVNLSSSRVVLVFGTAAESKRTQSLGGDIRKEANRAENCLQVNSDVAGTRNPWALLGANCVGDP